MLGITDDSYDVVTFKSVLGGVGSYENIENEKKMVGEINRVLKKGGYVVFIENMKASKIHQFLRKRLRKYGNRWHYQSNEHIEKLFQEFTLIDKKYYGLLGLFGVNETLRKILGGFDLVLEMILPNKCKYIGVYIFKKDN